MSWPARFESASRLSALTVAVLALGGWGLNVAAVKTGQSGLADMNVNTALVLGVLGLALWLCRAGGPAGQRRLGQGCAALAALLGAAALVEFLTGIPLGVDERLFADPQIQPDSPHRRPLPDTASVILLLGLGIAALDQGKRGCVAQWLAAVVLFLTLLSLAGRLFGSASVYGLLFFSPMGLQTMLASLALALGVAWARPGRGYMGIVAGAGPGGRLLRHLLPAALVLPYAFAWLVHFGADAGWFPHPFGVALLALSTTVLFTGLVGISAGVLEGEDVQRRQAEERFRLAVDGSPYAVLSVGRNGRITLVNVQAEALFGYHRSELIGQPVEILVPEFARAQHSAMRDGYFREPEVRALGMGRHLTTVRKDGRMVPVEISLAPITGPGVTEVLAVVIDISERRRAEEALLESEARFRQMVTSIRDYAIILLDPEGRVTGWNPGAERVKGYREDEIMGQSFACFYAQEDLALGKPQMELEIAARLGRYEDEGWRIRKGGSRFWANSVITSVHDEAGRLRGFVKVTLDLSERRRMEDQLRAANLALDQRVSERTGQLEEANLKLKQEIAEREQAERAVRAQLAENEVLLKEIHHRVKNNLQIVWSLLDLQSAGVADPAAAAALRDSQERVKSMALVHQVLYQSGRFARIEFRTYLEKLADGLFAAYQAQGIGLALSGEPLAVDMNTAIPLGLIANELISNSLKHAFPGGRRGELRIGLARDDGVGVLSVADDGIGLPPDSQRPTVRSLGLQLVYLLAGQIGADVNVGAGPGTCYTLKFPIKDGNPE